MIAFTRFTLAPVLLAVTTIANSAPVEFSQVPFYAFSAPLPGTPVGWNYIPQKSSNIVARPWGAIPSISFGVDDDKGTVPTCGGKYPKHLGTDWRAPANTQVYAIADGVVVRSSGFTTYPNGKSMDDAYIVVEHGTKDKWTATYGHLSQSLGLGLKVTQGKPIPGARLFNFNYAGDLPHLHLAIHKGAYDGTNSAVKGFACANEPQYIANKYNFISPDYLRYYTLLY